MAQKINISDIQREELKKAVYGCSKEFLQNAWNAARQQAKEKQITKKAGLKKSDWYFAELVLHQIRATSLVEADGITFWIDPKGIFKIKLPPTPYAVDTEKYTTDN